MNIKKVKSHLKGESLIYTGLTDDVHSDMAKFAEEQGCVIGHEYTVIETNGHWIRVEPRTSGTNYWLSPNHFVKAHEWTGTRAQRNHPLEVQDVLIYTVPGKMGWENQDGAAASGVLLGEKCLVSSVGIDHVCVTSFRGSKGSIRCHPDHFLLVHR